MNWWLHFLLFEEGKGTLRENVEVDELGIGKYIPYDGVKMYEYFQTFEYIFNTLLTTKKNLYTFYAIVI